MAAKLKVFTWSDGFHAFTVATTSRAKALAAWSVSRDLFKDGDASEITGGPDHDAALAKPGDIVKRGLSVDVGKVSAAANPKPPDKALVQRVRKLERELEQRAAAHDKARADIEERRSRLDEEAADLDRAFRDDTAAVHKALAVARGKLLG